MLFYDFTTLDDFIKNNLIVNIKEEKDKLENTINLINDKKNNLRNVTTNMIAVTNTVDKNEVNDFRDTVSTLKSSFEDIEKIEILANTLLSSLNNILDLYNNNLELNYNEIKAELIEYNKKSDELSNDIFAFEKNISSVLDYAIELSVTSSNNNLNNHISKDELNALNEFNLLKDNNTLIISEKRQLAYLPYICSEVEKIYKNSNGKYSSTQDVIDKLYILPLSKFKNSSISRFRESFNLIRNKENGSIIRALDLGLELMFKYNLNPIVIAACRNLDELDIYLDCLESKELFDFNCFEIKFEVSPQISKNKNVGI
ncbi:MAG: hypothetical protein HFJ40_02820 [Clostridia bacterium]|nr:hypothetical protein [Clostridia bacterium]